MGIPLSYSLSFCGFRSIRSSVFCKIGVKNFAKFKGKHLCWSLLSKEVAAETPVQVFPMNFELLITSFYGTPSGHCFLGNPDNLQECISSIGKYLCKVNIIYYNAEAVVCTCSIKIFF